MDSKVRAQQSPAQIQILLEYTKHARKQMKKRCLHPSEVELIYLHGTEVTAEEYFFRFKDVEKLKLIRPEIPTASIDRLIGCKVVVDFPNVITCYRCTKVSQKKRIKHLLH